RGPRRNPGAGRSHSGDFRRQDRLRVRQQGRRPARDRPPHGRPRPPPGGALMPTIAARPYEYAFDPARTALVVIDMQRDFLEPGGFGAALGNDVSRLAPVVPVVERLLQAFRARGLTVIHTKECHRPDLSDCPAAKRRRGRGVLTIGDYGPMGRILID